MEIFCIFLIIAFAAFLAWGCAGNQKDSEIRHKNDYGKVARCPKCGSTKVYAMTYDDKRMSISFWGAGSSKIGKRYHCDSCGFEW